MKTLLRPLAALGALASLAAASNAAITFSNFTGSGASFLSNDGNGVLKFEPNVFDGPVTNTISGSFTVATDIPGGHLTDGDVKVGNSLLFGGSIGYSATILGVGSAYNDTITTDGSSLATDGPSVPLSLGAYVVTYSLTYSGDFVSFTSSSFTFHDTGSTPPPVPEPASMAALGVGVMGLVARRRRTK